MADITEFPHEEFVGISQQPFLLGRLTVNKDRSHYNVEVDIIAKESCKIIEHLGAYYQIETPEDAIQKGFYVLRVLSESK